MTIGLDRLPLLDVFKVFSIVWALLGNTYFLAFSSTSMFCNVTMHSCTQ